MPPVGVLATACASSPDLDVSAPAPADSSTTTVATTTTTTAETTTTVATTTTTVATETTSTTTPPPETTVRAVECSAAELSAPPTPGELDGAAAATYRDIVDAAVACDYDGLAAAAGDEITLSFGGPFDVAPYLEDGEGRGEDLLRILVQLLAMPPGLLPAPDPHADAAAGVDIWVWPTFWEDDDPATADERAAIEAIYGVPFDDVLFEGDYLSYRVGIDADGNWLYFVAGD